MSARIAASLRFLVVALAAVASAATSKVESGDRAGGGECPVGEDCSDATPEGLYFAGMGTGDIGPFGQTWPRPVAVGGTQTVRIFTDPEAESPLDLPFAASISGESLAILEESGPSVTVEGVAEGSGVLRIAEPDADLLYDRITLDALEVGSARLVPAGQYGGRDLDLYEADGVGYAVVVGGAARVTAALFSVGGARVVDDSIEIERVAGVSADPDGYRDTVMVAPAQPGSVLLTVRSAGRVARLELPAVAAATHIEERTTVPPDGLRMTNGESRPVCFRARADEQILLGAEFTFRSSSELALSEPESQDAVTRCITVEARERGAGSLTVTAAGATHEMRIEVVAPARARAPAERPDLTPVEPALAGDRAENLQFLAR